jgi:hypothetical protein
MVPHKGTYISALFTPTGIRPIVDDVDFQALYRARDDAARWATPAMLFGISIDSLRAGHAERSAWVSDGGIVSPDGLGLFDLRQIEVEAA